MRGLRLSLHYAWSYSACRSEHFLMYGVSLNAEGEQIPIHFCEKSRRTTQVEVSLGWDSLQALQIKMSSNIEILAESVC